MVWILFLIVAIEGCPYNWTHLENHCYGIIPPGSNENVQNACIERNGTILDFVPVPKNLQTVMESLNISQNQKFWTTGTLIGCSPHFAFKSKRALHIRKVEDLGDSGRCITYSPHEEKFQKKDCSSHFHALCQVITIKIDGGFSAWTNGSCSKSCGDGELIQTRECSNPEPKFGGKPCDGPQNRTVHCNNGPCPIHGGFSEWINQACSTTCGMGEMVQTRTCTNPAPMFGGHDCSGSWEQVVPCYSQPCPIHGGLSDWINGTCSVSCGTGIMFQDRTCSNPEPRFGGRDCQGSLNRTLSCSLDPCPIHGGFSDWQNSSCSVSCGTGVMIRTRDCSNPEPKFGGKSCEGSYEQTVTCTLDPCPVHGGYSEWMNGPCSSTCGPGQLIQTRECSNPIPQFGGRSCEGPTSNVVPCEIVPCPVHGGFSKWESGPCSVSCGEGEMIQTRTCSNPVPQYGGKFCEGESNQTVPCIMDPCPIDGRFGEWSNGPCSVSCGEGEMVQTRTCSNPVPQYGGKFCEGESNQTVPCIMDPCPIDGRFGEWSNGPCSVSCGEGEMVQTRTCSNPVPQYGGMFCEGESNQTVPCIMDPCPIDGRFGEWSNGPCSVSCGEGEMVQTRTCSNPVPQYGGKDCIGDKTRTVECRQSECPQEKNPWPCLDFGHIYVPKSESQLIEAFRVHYAQSCADLCEREPDCRFTTYRRNICSLFRGSYTREPNHFVISSDRRNC